MTTVEEIHRKYFDVNLGEDLLAFQDVPGDAVKATCALAALAAVVRFTEFHQEAVILAHNLRIKFLSIKDVMVMNISTAHHLELCSSGGFRKHRSARSLASLFSCRTVSGSNLLTLSLRSPPTSMDTITSRQDCVDFFTSKHDAWFVTQNPRT